MPENVKGHPLAAQNLWSTDPTLLYPDPDYRDVILVERISRKQGNYTVLPSGMAYPWDGQSPNPFPNHFLVDEREEQDGENVLRYYAADRSNASQQTYNQNITYEADSKDHPTFVRDYIIRRGVYTPSTRLTIVSGLIAARITAVGSGYDQDTVSAVLSGGTGSGGVLQVFVNPAGECLDIEIVTAGNYTVGPTVTITGGSGATATVDIQSASTVLVSEELRRLQDETLDSMFVLVRRTYMTLPGPILRNRTLVRENLYLVRRTQKVLPDALPAVDTANRDTVAQQTTTYSIETVDEWENAAGAAVGQPIFSNTQYRPDLDVWQTDFRQRQTFPGNPPEIGSRKGVGGVGPVYSNSTTAYVIASTAEDEEENELAWVRWSTIPAPMERFSDRTFEADNVSFPAFTWNSWVPLADYVAQVKGTARTGLMAVKVTAGGSGFPGDSVSLTFTGGAGSGAVGFGRVVSGVIVSAYISDPGTGYTSAPAVSVSGGSGATLVAQIQPTTCVLVKEVEQLAEGALGGVFTRVQKHYETMSGPVFETIKYDAETDAWITTYTQQQARPGVTKVLGSAYGTGAVSKWNSAAATAYVIASDVQDRDEWPQTVQWSTIPIPLERFRDETVQDAAIAYPAFTFISWKRFTDLGAFQTPATARTALAWVEITGGGSGYTGDSNGLLALSISGGAGSGAAGYAVITSGAVTSAFLTNAGTGYTSAPTVSVSGGTGATLVAVLLPTTCYLVDEKRTLPGEGMAAVFCQITKHFMTLPGPLLTTKTHLASGIILEETRQDILAGTNPAGGTNVILDVIADRNTVVAQETIRQYVNVSGTPIGAPIYIRADYIQEYLAFLYTFRQMQVSPGTIKAFDSTDTGYINSGAEVTALTLTAAGTGYTYLPSVTIAASSGIQATGSATMKVDGNPTPIVAGSAYAVNDTLTIPGGSVSATLNVDSLGLSTVLVNAAGTGVTSSGSTSLFTLTGGTHTTAAVVQFATGALLTLLVSNKGSGYTSGGGNIKLLGGIYSAQAQAAVSTLSLVSLSLNNPGSFYNTGDLITLGGGTSTTKAIVLVQRTTAYFVVGSLANYGSTTGTGWNVGDTVTLENGTQPGTGLKIVVQIASLGASSLTIDAPGTGYAVNDLVSLTEVTSCQLKITSVSGGGVVTGFDINFQGDTTDNTIATSTTYNDVSAGVGFTVKNIVWDAIGIGFQSIINPGLYTDNNFDAGWAGSPYSEFTSGATSGGGVNATFAVAFQIATDSALGTTISNQGNYTVESSTFTQFSTTSVNGSGATYQSALFGLRTVTVAVAGNFTMTSGTFTQDPLTTNPGTGAAFSTTSFSLLTGTVITAGSYTSTLPATFTTTNGTGVTFNTPVWGVGNTSLVTTGSGYTDLHSEVTALVIKSRGVGHAPGDVLTVSAGTGSITITVLSITGSQTKGPISTFAITNGIGGVDMHLNTIFSETSSTSVGTGATFITPTFRARFSPTGGSGTGAVLAVLFKVDALVLGTHGTQYKSAPTVTIEGPATGTSTITNLGTGGLTSATIYVVDASILPIPDTDRVESIWKMMAIPPDKTEFIMVPFTKPGRMIVYGDIGHDPMWPGLDYALVESVQSGQWIAKRVTTWRLGLGTTTLLPVWRLDAPGAISRFFPLSSRLIRHGSFFGVREDGTYGESFGPSTEVGLIQQDGLTVFTVENYQKNPIGNMWMLVLTTIQQ